MSDVWQCSAYNIVYHVYIRRDSDDIEQTSILHVCVSILPLEIQWYNWHIVESGVKHINQPTNRWISKCQERTVRFSFTGLILPHFLFFPESEPGFVTWLCSVVIVYVVRGNVLFCWYWWNCWLSLFMLSFHIHDIWYLTLEFLHCNPSIIVYSVL